MKHFSKLLLAILFVGISLPAMSQDCSEFGNNHFMKWIDFDASCIGIEDLVSKIESEGKWELMNPNGIEDQVLTYESKSDSNMSLEVMFLGIDHKGATILEVNLEKKCRHVLTGLEEIGFPPFKKVQYDLSDGNSFGVMMDIEDSSLFISSNMKDGTCLNISLMHSIL